MFEIDPSIQSQTTQTGWTLDMFFGFPPDEDSIGSPVAPVARDAVAQTLTFMAISETGGSQASLEGLKPLRPHEIGLETKADLASAPAVTHDTRLSLGCLLTLSDHGHGIDWTMLNVRLKWTSGALWGWSRVALTSQKKTVC